MGVSAAVFESAGKRTEHYVPGVYSRSHNVTSPNGVSAGNLCIIGKSNGGKPTELLEFGSLAEAKNVLVGGELLTAIAYAFNGSNDYIPQKIYAMRVNNGTQSTLTLKSGATDLMKLYSWDYGSHTNQLKVWVNDGDTAEARKISVVYKDTVIESGNINKESLKISYVGEGENPSIQVTKEALIISDEDNTEEIRFADYDLLIDLVSKINDGDLFYAELVETDVDAKSSDLDTLTTTELSGDTPVSLFSNYKAIKDWFMSCDFIGDVEDIGDTRIVPEANDGFKYFSGGSAGEGSIVEWGNALDKLATEDIQIIATPSAENDVHTFIANHCAEMSTTVNRKERTCILGGVIGESDEVAIQKAVGFNSELVSYVVDNAKVNNPLTGKTELVNGAILACMLAGMEAAMAVNTPLTNKTLKVIGFGKVRNITNMEKLIKKGIMVCNPSPEDMTNFVCIRALTTFQTNDLIKNERSMTRENLFMNRDLRAKFAPSIGTPNNGSTATIIQTLKSAADVWRTNGYIIPNDSGESVWNIAVSVNGDKIYLTFSRYLAAPTNFVFITAINNIYTTTVSI